MRSTLALPVRLSAALLTLALALPSTVFALRAGLESTVQKEVGDTLKRASATPSAVGLEQRVPQSLLVVGDQEMVRQITALGTLAGVSTIQTAVTLQEAATILNKRRGRPKALIVANAQVGGASVEEFILTARSKQTPTLFISGALPTSLPPGLQQLIQQHEILFGDKAEALRSEPFRAFLDQLATPAGLEEGIKRYSELNELAFEQEPGLRALREANEIPPGADGRPVVAVRGLRFFDALETEPVRALANRLVAQARTIPGFEDLEFESFSFIEEIPENVAFSQNEVVFVETLEAAERVRQRVGHAVTIVNLNDLHTPTHSFEDLFREILRLQGILLPEGQLEFRITPDKKTTYIFA